MTKKGEMKCPYCDNNLYRLEGSRSEPEGIREDAYCVECHILFAITKSGYIKLREEGLLTFSCPKIKKRRPLDDDNPDGYQESDKDFVENNINAVLWFLERMGG
ncbi:MAG: hypothetical protein ACFFG0_01345 [Candidatus Thorarchaeota archaeon]